ncbi:hypothetical protein [Paenibacillus eucommiae]|uniref:Peptide zinc metalloprotease protein n=1 Tax=Paenibacillus eucommiae TaxID=1355755 RepID=A0ABS4IPV1_9BACL|nr:hypothetical protein [Paenibacillus eucommiae]MBP1989599.1 hypothetical protein [Paenibacillus eucommiae]
MDIKLSLFSKVCLSHLSIQKEGNEYTIGDPNIPKFIRVPEAAVFAVNDADGFRTIEEIKTNLMREHGIDVDVLDFFSKLLAIGFVKSVDDIVLLSDAPPSSSHERIVKVSKIFFNSWTAKLFVFNFFAVLVLFSIKPDLLPHFKDIFVLPAVGINAFVVICLTYFLIFLHEMAHYFCSYSKGIKATIRLSRRFIFVAAETKMTGLWSKPKIERYFPYLAGMALDVTLIFICLLVQVMMPENSLFVTISRLVAFLLFTGILGQFMVFLRTDVYFVLINATNSSNLFQNGMLFLKSMTLRKRQENRRMWNQLPKTEKEASIWFSLIYVFGIGIVLVLFVFFTFPAFLTVVSRAYNETVNFSMSHYRFWDGIASFTVIVLRLALLLIGSRNTYLDRKRRLQSEIG